MGAKCKPITRNSPARRARFFFHCIRLSMNEWLLFVYRQVLDNCRNVFIRGHIIAIYFHVNWMRCKKGADRHKSAPRARTLVEANKRTYCAAWSGCSQKNTHNTAWFYSDGMIIAYYRLAMDSVRLCKWLRTICSCIWPNKFNLWNTHETLKVWPENYSTRV